MERDETDPAVRIVRHVKSSAAPNGPDFSFEIRPETGFRWRKLDSTYSAPEHPEQDLPKNKHDLAAILLTRAHSDSL